MQAFKETQKFTQWWMLMIYTVLLVIAVWAPVQQLVYNKPFGNQPMSDTGVLIFSFLMLVFVFAFSRLRLHTLIDDTGIHIKFSPFANTTIAWKDIEKAELVDYGFVGGWGWRFSKEYGTVYNVRGRKGLYIKQHNGKKCVVGSQRIKDLDLFLSELKTNE